MPSPHTIAFLGNYAPRCCGIATFTQDLRSSVCGIRPAWDSPVAMVSDDPEGYAYPGEVRWVLAEKDRSDYKRMARKLNEAGVRSVSLQHEYGIFGGPCGAWLVDLMEDLRMPVVTTCHTVLKEPSEMQMQVLRQIAGLSSRMVVMAEKGREFLRDIYGVPESKISVIPHGIPDISVDARTCAEVRRQHGWQNRHVILTFGLLSPNKGIENAIRALPKIVDAHPETLYVVLGATHPNLTRGTQQDVYREGLQRLVAELGMERHVQFINRFVTREELVAFIATADIYTTPYLNEAQITSGTLAYAFGLGKPVISTPYWYAAELLADGAGVLVPFDDSAALADGAIELLTDDQRRENMGALARQKGSAMAWPEVARQYVRAMDQAAAQPLRQAARSSVAPSWQGVPPVSLAHLHRMCGDYGIFQHARYSYPDPVHGFCTDDNARGVILLSDLMRSGDAPKETAEIMEACLPTLLSAFNEEIGRFRNFQSSDGCWLEDRGSEDSHGRALWALGHVLPHMTRDRETMCDLFLKGLHATRHFTSPRSWAFTLLGLAGFRTLLPHDANAQKMQEELANRLVRLFRQQAGPQWQWFESSVTYDNAKIPQALLATARQLCRSDLRIIALNSLQFLVENQRAPGGWFRAVGCKGFWKRGGEPAQFDQQPLETQAMVAACIEAEQSTGDRQWLDHAERIYGWFHGQNDLKTPMADIVSGACYDGLQKEGINLNQGAESTLAYLQATVELRDMLAARCPSTRFYPAVVRQKFTRPEAPASVSEGARVIS